MADERIWGLADLTCRSCRATMLLCSPEMQPSESNLTGKTDVVCSVCGSRIAARELPQSQQAQIAARLRLLLESDEFVPVSLAVGSLLGTPLLGRRAETKQLRSVASQDSEHQSGHATPGRRAVPLPKDPQTESVPRRESAEELAPPVDTTGYQLFAKLGAAEAKLLGAVHEMSVGEVVKNRKHDPNFSVARLRIPVVEPAFFTKIEVELVRYKTSGRRNSLGFSLDEIEALRRGLTARRDVILTQDSIMNTVGLLRFYRIKGGQVATVEVYRRRSGPQNFSRPLA